MLEELIDRFGEPTKAVLNLLAIARLKALAHQGYVTEIKQLGKDVRITLYEKAKLDPAGIPAIMAQYRRGLQFKADHERRGDEVCGGVGKTGRATGVNGRIS